MARADYVSHHGDLLLTSETLALLSGPMVFISVDRPTTLRFDSLIEACCERGARVAVDVATTAEGDALRQLAEHPSALVTRDLASTTLQALGTLSREVVKTVHTMLQSGRLQNGVNLSSASMAAVTMVIRQTHDAGALATLFDALRTSDIEVLDVHSQLFTNGKTATVSVQLGKVPPPRLIEQLERQGNIQRLDVVCHHVD